MNSFLFTPFNHLIAVRPLFSLPRTYIVIIIEIVFLAMARFSDGF
jgi:hypothetical protein